MPAMLQAHCQSPEAAATAASSPTEVPLPAPTLQCRPQQSARCLQQQACNPKTPQAFSRSPTPLQAVLQRPTSRSHQHRPQKPGRHLSSSIRGQPQSNFGKGGCRNGRPHNMRVGVGAHEAAELLQQRGQLPLTAPIQTTTLSAILGSWAGTTAGMATRPPLSTTMGEWCPGSLRLCTWVVCV